MKYLIKYPDKTKKVVSLDELPNMFKPFFEDNKTGSITLQRRDGNLMVTSYEVESIADLQFYLECGNPISTETHQGNDVNLEYNKQNNTYSVFVNGELTIHPNFDRALIAYLYEIGAI
jgi:hypothetical protein